MKCPACNSKMVKRHSVYGPFWGCSNYPTCKETINIDEEDYEDGSTGYGPCIRCGEVDVLSDMGFCNYCQHMWDKD